LFLTRYTKRPLHLFGLAGIVSFVLGFGVTAYLAAERLIWSVYLTNRPLLFLGILLMIIGVQMFSIGLIGEMITATNTQAPAYFVKTELGFGKKPG
jgi:dolichol-phosphate mannosyltransferase